MNAANEIPGSQTMKFLSIMLYKWQIKLGYYYYFDPDEGLYSMGAHILDVS